MLSVVPTPLTIVAPAKINLHLSVGELRDDGFHDLTTVFHAVSLYDTLTVRNAPTRSITVSGPGADQVPTDTSNLASRAVDAVAAFTGHGGEVAIEIAKGIPVAGGMAGGSTDAAAVIAGLKALWKLELDRADLDAIAADLGSDVPFSLRGGCALGTGRGEQLMSVLARGEFHWVIATSTGGLSTPQVYRELDALRRSHTDLVPAGPPDGVLQALAAGDPHRLATVLHNDLQPAAISLMPTLRRTLRAGTDAGALAGIVSGSGPTCVFLCSDVQHAVNVATELSGAGVARAVRTASGPTPGARIVDPQDK